MKTPEEIKKGLEFHYVTRRCQDCPYTADEEFKKTCFQLLSADALTYIQQLEASLAQAERERDAALHDLEEFSFCANCKHYSESVFNEPCSSCVEDIETKKHWQWRGIYPENTKEDANGT